jgi:hypothetical protein
MELAVAVGYRMATEPGYAAKVRASRGGDPRGRSGDRSVEDWASKLAALSGQTIQRTPAPADSPVNGVTPESFRAEVEAMRQAERARQVH